MDGSTSNSIQGCGGILSGRSVNGATDSMDGSLTSFLTPNEIVEMGRKGMAQDRGRCRRSGLIRDLREKRRTVDILPFFRGLSVNFS